MFNRLNQSIILLAWLFVAVSGVIVGWLAHERERSALRSLLVTDAARCALAFRADEIDALSGTPADHDAAAFKAVKARLVQLRSLQPTVRSVALFRFLPESGAGVRLVDSEPETKEAGLAENTSPAASRVSDLASVVRDLQPAVNGVVRDSSGDFVMGYAMLASVPRTEAAGTRHVLALAVSTREWNRGLWFGVLRSATLGWLLAGLPVAGFLWLRHRSDSAALLRKLYGAVDQSESAILIVNLQGVIDYANAGMCLQTGYPREELVGQPWRQFIHGMATADAFAEVVAQVRTGFSWEGQLTNRRKDGETYPARAAVSPVRTPAGKIAGFIAIITDMSEAERKESELRAAKEQAEEADRAKGKFLATMSHEVRTPLNGMVGFASLLADTPLNPEQREYVQTIRTSGQALIQLTGDILDFSKIESGKLQLEHAPCDLRANMEDALDIFAGRAAEKRIHLLHWVEPDVPEQVLIDGGRLRQVLINLVGNAIKFTPGGEVDVSLRLLTGKSVSLVPFDDIARGQLVAEFDDGGITLEFAVRDTGIGIAEKDRARLFQPFSQLDASTVRRFGGAGLGLAISRNLVRLMGGDIHVESEKGRGSTFIFTIRTRSANAAPADHSQMYPLTDRTVAVAVPIPALCRELVRLLRQAGAQTVECSFAELAKGGWDLAIVDCDPAVIRALSGEPVAAGWRSEAVFGLVPMHLGTVERQDLRRHFRILLNKPVHHRTLVDLLTKSARGLARKGGANEPASFGFRVLMADDDTVQQRLLRDVLETLGCRCDTVDNARTAFTKLTAEVDDLVLLDLHMPEIDGLTALKQIRAGEIGETARDTWIVAFTGDGRSEIRDMALAAGANDFLAKPVRLAELEAALQRCHAGRKPLAV